MKRRWLVATGLVVVAAAVVVLVLARPRPAGKQIKSVGSKGMKITSSAFMNNGAIPGKYSCQGEGPNPPLTFTGVPDSATALALVVDDPDAPNGTFDHWVVWNLASDQAEVPENWAPSGGAVVGANGAGKSSWYPPCPPSGTHHYYFKLYALDRKLDLAAGSDKAALEQAMAGHVVAQTELVGTYTKR
jgi:Raf kinase inhibitor-like YbhB/YbcL family protein